ncbi:prolyl aminopeptidase [Mycoplasmopsis felifaucium]|uniref:prolyl aminopeptidase n=1 Tax=Mycoplasmopsis felifaucium TaxID=35768 RepID=UPI00055E88EF|nr:prolyl aminopeptidase [Mycoplasmopsis felifaucium]
MAERYLDLLYPEIEPYECGYLKTRDGLHEIYYEVCGNTNGEPILYVHGGPGGGTSKPCRRYFDPSFYKIVLFDQRGCGNSKPSMSLENNETMFLVEDMEMIRKHLNIEKWSLFGGSWGSSLSLIYAINHPEKVNNLILRGVFLVRKQDINWLYQSGSNYFNPIEFERYYKTVPKGKRRNMVAAYHELMNNPDPDVKHRALVEWARWESINVKLKDNEFNENEDLKGIYEIALIENHYFYHNSFIEENYILKNVKKIQNIPTYIVHGSYDLICWPIDAYLLHKKLKKSELYYIHDAGHTQREVGTTERLVKITDHIRDVLKAKSV